MTTNPLSHNVRRSAIVVAIALLAGFNAAVSQYCAGQELPAPAAAPATATQEPIPPPDGAQLNAAQLPQGCDVPSDTPLFALTTDIQPRIDGKPVPEQNLPVSCSKFQKPVQRQAMSIDLSCDTCHPGYSNLLNMARFCHKPLYFNDDCLERCGVEWCCCQPCASAACFYGGALLMPVRAFCVCPCSCVPSGGCCR